MGSEDMGFVVAIVSQKGGVGKSTLARAIAAESVRGWLSVKVADLDTQQATFADWHRKRLDMGREAVASVEVFGSVKKALSLTDAFDLLVIDGPARSSAATLELGKSADVVIQPTGAGRDDLRPAVRLFYELEKANVPKSRLFFALSRVGTPSEEEEARAYLEDAGFSVLSGSFLERPAYRQSQNEGLAVTETRYPTLNERAKALTNSILGV
jgi:chromosome partitioning protein